MIRAMFLLALLLVLGCGAKSERTAQRADEVEPAQPVPQNDSPQSEAADEVSHAEPSDAAATDAESREDESSGADASVDGSSAEESIDQSEDEAAEEPVEVEEEEEEEAVAATDSPKPPPAYQLWFPTTKGPLLIGLDIHLDDQPLATAFRDKIERILEQATPDEEDSLAWSSFIDHVAADPDTFGMTARQVASQSKQLIKKYDRNQNKRVEFDEATRFLFRSSRVSQELRLVGTDSFRWSNRSDSAIFRAMDSDNNRKLSAEEIASAPASILQHVDQNADACLSLSEVIDAPDPNQDPWHFRKSHRLGSVAMDLVGYVDWSNVSFAMNGMLNQSPQRDLSDLDVDGDGELSSEEARLATEATPSISLTIKFPIDEAVAPSVSASVDSTRCSAEVLESAHGDRVTILGDDLRIDVALHDRPQQTNRIPREAFDLLDANKDGGLDADEIPDEAEAQLPIEDLDQDGDEKLTYEEINANPKNTESIWAYQVRGRAAEFPAAIFSWLDRDGDQFLAEREIAQAGSHAASLAGSGDLRPEAFPDTVLIQFGRGEPEQDTQLFRLGMQARRSSQDGRPEWAIKMDFNRDGDISRLEFPGAIAQFDALDKNGDGFLQAEEVTDL